MTFRSIINRLRFLFVTLFAFVGEIFAQNPALKNSQEDYTWWYLTLFALVAALAGTILVWMKKKKSAEKEETEKKSKINKDDYDDNSLSFDADKELEWLRRNQKVVDRTRRKPKAAAQNMPQTPTKQTFTEEIPTPLSIDLLNNTPLPIFEFKHLEPAAHLEPLPLSNDESLLNAIEQTQDEYEEDEEIRDLALRILTAFRTRNSVDALSQAAVYDLSSTLRSRAVSILSEFDHESCFEAILLACADPTREVRAAAARAFSRLTFDRADAWVRIIETNEQGRMIHAARAAIEGGFVERSFDRLTHRDKKAAYEAFALFALLIKAGEIQPILDAVYNHRDMQVRRAVIHVLSVVKDENSFSILEDLLKDDKLPEELKKEVNETLAPDNLATA